MLTSRADIYFDLDNKQQEALRKDVDKDIQLVGKEAIPEIAKSLRALNKELAGAKVNSEKTKVILGQADDALKKGAACFNSSAQKLTASLSEEQFHHFRKKMLNDIEESSRETSTPQLALKKSTEFYTKGLTYWTGSVSDEQRKRVTTFLKSNPYPWKLQNESRKKVLDGFIDKRRSPQELEKYVKEFFTDHESLRTPEFQAALKNHRVAATKFVFEDLWPKLSPAQKSKLKANLVAKAELLEDFAQKKAQGVP